MRAFLKVAEVRQYLQYLVIERTRKIPPSTGTRQQPVSMAQRWGILLFIAPNQD
jgi:hypothetical protein